MSWIYDTQRKCYVFREGGLIPKYQNAGVLQKIYYWRSPKYEGSFGEAFSLARQNGDEDFWWNGNIYNTKVKPEELKSLTSPLDITHRFKTIDFDEFVSVMHPIFEQSLTSRGLPTTQLLNIIRLAAYESAYGTKPRGALGYNLGGIQWVNNPRSNSYKYKHTRHTDGNEYIDFDSLLDYADYVINLLNETYLALSAKDTPDFVNRLHGHNPYKKSYSINPQGYMLILNLMKSLDRAYNDYVVKRKQSQ